MLYDSNHFHMNQELQSRHDLAQFGKRLHDAGHVAATDGNLSVRLDDGRILATPTGMSKGMMHPEGHGDRGPGRTEMLRRPQPFE